MKKKYLFFVFIIISILVATSCKPNNSENSINSQNKTIESGINRILTYEENRMVEYTDYLFEKLTLLEKNIPSEKQEKNISIIMFKSLMGRDTVCSQLQYLNVENSIITKCESLYENFKFGSYERDILGETISDEELTIRIMKETNSTQICEAINESIQYLNCIKIIREVTKEEEENIITKFNADEIEITIPKDINCNTCIYENTQEVCYEQNACTKKDFVTIIESYDKNPKNHLFTLLGGDLETIIFNFKLQSAILTKDPETFCKKDTNCFLSTVLIANLTDVNCNNIQGETNINYCNLLISINKESCDNLEGDFKELCVAQVQNLPCENVKLVAECEAVNRKTSAK